MLIRKTAAGEIPAVLDIYGKARLYMRENGNMKQWSDGYPDRQVIEEDIEKGVSYVAVEDGEITAVFAFIKGPDRTYINIYDGKWLNDSDYYVIHRIAVSLHRRGVASQIFAWAYSQCPNIKIDTHRDNIPMQNSLKKNGFEYCGIIYLENGEERLAFQKTEEEK